LKGNRTVKAGGYDNLELLHFQTFIGIEGVEIKERGW
jgi:hypothetical protein